VSESAAHTVHVVVPDGIDDPARPSGGSVYDRRLCGALAELGWSVREHRVPGCWPFPDAEARAGLAAVLAALPADAVALVDGIVGSLVPEVLVPEAVRLRLVPLMHMSFGGVPGSDGRARECAVLSAARAVVTTSEWTRSALLERYRVPPARVHVARPGVDDADLAPGTPAGGELLCVAAVTPEKGYAALLAALTAVADRPWRLVCVGSLTRDPDFAGLLARRARDAGIEDRVEFTGPETGPDLDRRYGGADVLVTASHQESYGMVVVEALARGLPVVATAVGGLPEALGRLPDGRLPGLLVTPGDPDALAEALASWLDDADLRERLRRHARERRTQLSGWPTTARRVSRVLEQVAR